MAFQKLYKPTPEEMKAWQDCADNPSPPGTRQAWRTIEFDRFNKERAELTAAEQESEKSYDTLLVTISTVAIGASFTLLKDFVHSANGWIILAWIALGICFVSAVADKLLSYQFHKRWRESLDDIFTNYHLHCGYAWKEADARLAALADERVFRTLKASDLLHRLKWIAFISMTIGVLLMMVYAYVGTGNAASVATATSTAAPAASTTINIFPTTQPSSTPIVMNVFSSTQPHP